MLYIILKLKTLDLKLVLNNEATLKMFLLKTQKTYWLTNFLSTSITFFRSKVLTDFIEGANERNRNKSARSTNFKEDCTKRKEREVLDNKRITAAAPVEK